MSASSEGEKTAKSGTQVERASERELVIRRVFRAQPGTVFDAMTKPELLRRWWAPRSLGFELIDCQADVKVGGSYRYVFGRPGQPAMAFSGVYREVVLSERVPSGVVVPASEPHATQVARETSATARTAEELRVIRSSYRAP
jgi:uncharacterized protein YndB with AHSA1/START domain